MRILKVKESFSARLTCDCCLQTPHRVGSCLAARSRGLAAGSCRGLVYLFEARGKVFDYLEFIALLAALYLLYRLLAWGRSRLLWSLRNRLIVAGLFIAVVPVLLLVLLAVRSAGVLYSQLASYLLYEDVQRRKDML